MIDATYVIISAIVGYVAGHGSFHTFRSALYMYTANKKGKNQFQSLLKIIIVLRILI
jgi:hypothetical protein